MNTDKKSPDEGEAMTELEHLLSDYPPEVRKPHCNPPHLLAYI
jgi:hypothetical protein